MQYTQEHAWPSVLPIASEVIAITTTIINLLRHITIPWHWSKVSPFQFTYYDTVEPRFTDTRLIRTPRYYGQFRWSRRKPHTFSFNLTRLIRTPVNTDNGHLSVSRVTNCHTLSTSLYGHCLSVHWQFSLSRLFANFTLANNDIIWRVKTISHRVALIAWLTKVLSNLQSAWLCHKLKASVLSYRLFKWVCRV